MQSYKTRKKMQILSAIYDRASLILSFPASRRYRTSVSVVLSQCLSLVAETTQNFFNTSFRCKIMQLTELAAVLTVITIDLWLGESRVAKSELHRFFSPSIQVIIIVLI